jgi:hypothetical protein
MDILDAPPTVQRQRSEIAASAIAEMRVDTAYIQAQAAGFVPAGLHRRDGQDRALLIGKLDGQWTHVFAPFARADRARIFEPIYLARLWFDEQTDGRTRDERKGKQMSLLARCVRARGRSLLV